MPIHVPSPGALPLCPLSGTRYPSAAVEVLDLRFGARIGNTPVERIASGFSWVEGLVYFPVLPHIQC